VGEVIALVGSSGSGKTTLVGLIPRFYDPTSGSVLIDGTDIREYTQRSLRGQIAIVTQETFLFNDTIRNNIAYGDVEHLRRELSKLRARRWRTTSSCNLRMAITR
jgi:subfamily B ATP-binding cassette protein MsbA